MNVVADIGFPDGEDISEVSSFRHYPGPDNDADILISDQHRIADVIKCHLTRVRRRGVDRFSLWSNVGKFELNRHFEPPVKIIQ